MNTFVINGKTVTAKPITFNTVVEFEKNGLAIEEIGEKKFLLVQVYTAYCMDISLEKAGEEINSDPSALAGIMEAFGTEVEESGFFRALNEGTKKKTPASKKAGE